MIEIPTGYDVRFAQPGQMGAGPDASACEGRMNPAACDVRVSLDIDIMPSIFWYVSPKLKRRLQGQYDESFPLGKVPEALPPPSHRLPVITVDSDRLTDQWRWLHMFRSEDEALRAYHKDENSFKNFPLVLLFVTLPESGGEHIQLPLFKALLEQGAQPPLDASAYELAGFDVATEPPFESYSTRIPAEILTREGAELNRFGLFEDLDMAKRVLGHFKAANRGEHLRGVQIHPYALFVRRVTQPLT